MLLNRKAKGDLAELKVAADLRARGYKIAFPYGEDWDFDLILARNGALERVQVKYARSAGGRLVVRCRSHSLTGGKVVRTKCYTAETIDWLAVYDDMTGGIYYIPASELGEGMFEMTLRTQPARNNQQRGVRLASRYTTL